ncbi:Rnf-Nqr domain containing protein [Pseudomonas sp. NCCP-436]|uniref:Rnf-Nqr domain containing protein n=1 Tax=Pseudomonas sp. NCCP-436 TaxID=2842481 RepID=UPI001C7F3AF3|nr:Rnf-Nqr domain containing protein [Pseudomonas sp. NCCP-436]GIZ11036.1 hypothetical protein NCCP436_04520 [Pseudomonas sp. NCCP-436]
MTDLLFVLLGAALISHLLLDLPPASAADRPARLQALGPCAALLIPLAAVLGWLLEQLLQMLGFPILFLLLGSLLLTALTQLLPAWLASRHAKLKQPGLWLILFANGLAALLLARTQPMPQILLLGLAGGAGFWLLMQLLEDLRTRIDMSAVPTAFRGAPLMLISGGLTGLALLGLNSLGAR